VAILITSKAAAQDLATVFMSRGRRGKSWSSSRLMLSQGDFQGIVPVSNGDPSLLIGS
jgi:hypothetical protein